MKRLTFEGNFCDIAQCRELPCPYNGSCSQREIWEQLKAYEDTGCEPGEVLPKDKADDIALKLMRLADLESLCSYTRLREIAEADVAPVVRCKECANFRQNPHGGCYCNEYGGAITPEDYCSRAVRESEPPAR